MRCGLVGGEPDIHLMDVGRRWVGRAPVCVRHAKAVVVPAQVRSIHYALEGGEVDGEVCIRQHEIDLRFLAFFY